MRKAWMSWPWEKIIWWGKKVALRKPAFEVCVEETECAKEIEKKSEIKHNFGNSMGYLPRCFLSHHHCVAPILLGGNWLLTWNLTWIHDCFIFIKIILSYVIVIDLGNLDWNHPARGITLSKGNRLEVCLWKIGAHGTCGVTLLGSSKKECFLSFWEHEERN